jgi:hypothetical protein
MENDKVPYICGPLTELPYELKGPTRKFYESLADVCQEETGKRAFVPHEHYDPIKHANFSITEVYQGEKKQVCEKTSLLIVVAIAPSWGGGIEVGMADANNIPIIILHPTDKIVSRLLLGIPSIICRVVYDSQENALYVLRNMLRGEIAKQLSPHQA